jgi:GDP-4-dehydro-6-deoxy-D-mannose reductase
MEKYLITGFSGFVSQHFLDFLEDNRIQSHVLGIDVYEPEFDFLRYRFVECDFQKRDLLAKEQIEDIFKAFHPDYILHLASYSSVAYSWENPIDSFANNTNIFLNLLEKVKSLNNHCRILSIGSSEEYGNVNQENIPITESQPLNPLSPYAVARVAQEMISRVYVDGYGMDIVMTRSFNHIGTGQKDVFVIPSFARQLIEIKNGLKPKEITTGDLSIIRDFVDVRDVVAAYYYLFKKGKKGEVYNVCSNKGTTLEEILFTMAEILDLEVAAITDKKLVRLNDNRIIIGSNEKLRKEIGWECNYTLEQSLRDTLNYWKNKFITH